MRSHMFPSALRGVTPDLPGLVSRSPHTGFTHPKFTGVAIDNPQAGSPYLPPVGSVGGHRTPGQRRVTREVYAALMARKIVNHSQISRATGLSPKTVRTFFSGAR